jgi:hypothetical protein
VKEFIEIIGEVVIPIVVAVVGGVFGAKRFIKKRTSINKSKGNFISDGNKNNAAPFNNNYEKNVGYKSAFIKGDGNTVNVFPPSSAPGEDRKIVDGDEFLKKSGLLKKAEENGYKLGWVNLHKVETCLLDGWEYVVDDKDGKKLLDKYGKAVLLKRKKDDT